MSDTWSGAFQLTADTHPEAMGPLAATPECATPEGYRALIRRRYRNRADARQQLAVLARHLAYGASRAPLPITGPFAAEARAILTAISNQPQEDQP
ncbi:hypothetical protein [Imhoffiella purpurea]|uniref:Uncharacterized protein n=1 Tax=Imhoffiella purpurea TaxID=1249627 RepID=W9V5W4_9GAMM|nr:hypothetical protein [Imhoffiella purpurea]EXJ14759.1 hypothetical protein D779_2128 [Imhoffiella purpurea]